MLTPWPLCGYNSFVFASVLPSPEAGTDLVSLVEKIGSVFTLKSNVRVF